MVEQRDCVGGVVGHRVRPGRDRRLPEPPLVVRGNVEALGERLDQQRTCRERRPRTVEEQQPRPVTGALVIMSMPFAATVGTGRGYAASGAFGGALGAVSWPFGCEIRRFSCRRLVGVDWIDMANSNFDEVVFTVVESTATPAQRITLADAGLTERSHLQEWTIAHPEILGADVLIVTFEFDQWSSASGPQRDRLDILGLGKDGRLVVAELNAALHRTLSRCRPSSTRPWPVGSLKTCLQKSTRSIARSARRR